MNGGLELWLSSIFSPSGRALGQIYYLVGYLRRLGLPAPLGQPCRVQHVPRVSRVLVTRGR